MIKIVVSALLILLGSHTLRAGEPLLARSLIDEAGSSDQLHVYCSSSDDSIVIKDGYDAMMDGLCTDLLLRVPNSWENLKLHSNLLKRFRQRYPNIRLHVSIPDFYLITTSSKDILHLKAYLQKLQAFSLDVLVSPTTNPGILSYTLQNIHVLMGDMRLSITIFNSTEITVFIDQGIIDLIDVVFAIPPQINTEPAAFGSEEVLIDVQNFTQRLIQSGIPAEKLVVGLASTVYSANVEDKFWTISSPSELCNGKNLKSWTPRRNFKDQVSWNNPEKNWKFRMLAGKVVADQVKDLRRRSVAGVLLFDLVFNSINPVCKSHKSFFVRSVRKALQTEENVGELMPEEESIEPEWKQMSGLINGYGRIGPILVFAAPGEQSKFVRYFNITNDDTLLASPIDHVVLGHDEHGHIYELSLPRCDESLAYTEALEDLINRHSLEVVVENQHPPAVLVFPGALADQFYPVPILITWLPIKPSNTDVSLRDQCHNNYFQANSPKMLGVPVGYPQLPFEEAKEDVTQPMPIDTLDSLLSAFEDTIKNTYPPSITTSSTSTTTPAPTTTPVVALTRPIWSSSHYLNRRPNFSDPKGNQREQWSQKRRGAYKNIPTITPSHINQIQPPSSFAKFVEYTNTNNGNPLERRGKTIQKETFDQLKEYLSSFSNNDRIARNLNNMN